jgi:hypothetical protein
VYSSIFVSSRFDEEELGKFADTPGSTQVVTHRKARQHKPMRSCVASILKMDSKVTGHSIAYAAVMVSLSLYILSQLGLLFNYI